MYLTTTLTSTFLSLTERYFSVSTYITTSVFLLVFIGIWSDMFRFLYLTVPSTNGSKLRFSKVGSMQDLREAST